MAQSSSIVINHAGHGIVSKAMTYSVPMMLLPWDRDQPGVAARAKKVSLAQVVPRSNANPQEVREAVAALFDDPRYREAAIHHSRRLAATDSIGTSCSFLEEFLIAVE